MADPASQIYRARPPVFGPDGQIATAPRRVTPYGDAIEQILAPSWDGLAEEGSLYVATNPTISTPVGFGVSASFSATAPMFSIANVAPAGGRVIRPWYIRLFVTTVPASGTSAQWLTQTDSVVRLPTAGNAGITPQNVSQAFPNDAQAIVNAGTGGAMMTVPAATNGRICGRGIAFSAIPVVLSEIIITFGQEMMSDGSAQSAVSRVISCGAAQSIPPGTSWGFYMWFPSNSITGISAEYEIAFSQR